MKLSKLALSFVLGSALTVGIYAQHSGGSSSSSGSSHSGGGSAQHSSGSPSHSSSSGYHSSGSSGYHSYSHSSQSYSHGSSSFGHSASSSGFGHSSSSPFGSSSPWSSHESSSGLHSYTRQSSGSYSHYGSEPGFQSGSSFNGGSGSSVERRSSGFGSQPHAFTQAHERAFSGTQHLSAVPHSTYSGNHNTTGSVGSSSYSGPALVHGVGHWRHIGPWRSGYRGYYSGWRDSFFFFPGYVFDVWAGPVVISPWYYYPSLPAYLPYDSVIQDDDYVNWNDGSAYAYSQDMDGSQYGNPDLNYSLDELAKIFNDTDESALGELIDDSKQVGIYNDGSYMYSVKGSDFHQMMLDNMHAVENVDFSVTNVTTKGEEAVVRAKHDFSSPDGGNETVYQEYRLQRDGDHFVIVDFNTSKTQASAQTFF
jgi:hypothetical protein